MILRVVGSVSPPVLSAGDLPSAVGSAAPLGSVCPARGMLTRNGACRRVGMFCGPVTAKLGRAGGGFTEWRVMFDSVCE